MLRDYLSNGPLDVDRDDYLRTQAAVFKDQVAVQTDFLEQILHALSLYEEPANEPSARRAQENLQIRSDSTEVFVVYGSDDRWKPSREKSADR